MYKCETHGCDKQQVVHAGGKTTYECQECDRERVRAFTQGFDKPAATGSGEPRCAECGVPRELHDDPKQYITPPASQSTVTLDRGTVAKFVAALAFSLEQWELYADERRCDGEWLYQATDHEATVFQQDTELLAQLRAAEQRP